MTNCSLAITQIPTGKENLAAELSRWISIHIWLAYHVLTYNYELKIVEGTLSSHHRTLSSHHRIRQGDNFLDMVEKYKQQAFLSI